MKLTKLFTGAAVAALLTAGAANAQSTLQAADYDANAGDDFGAAFIIASERNLTATAANAITGNFEIRVDGTGAGTLENTFNGLAVTDSVDVTLTLSGDMVFGSNLSNSAFIGNDDSGVPGNACEFQIFSGGAQGSKSVTFRLTAGANGADATANNAQQCDSDEIIFDLPVSITGAGNISAAFSLAATGVSLGNLTFDAVPGAGAGQAGVQEIVRVASGYGSNFASNTGTEAIALTTTNPYTTFRNSPATIATITVNDAGDAGGTNGVLFNATNAALTATDVTQAAQVSGGTLTVTFPQPAGIASVTLGLTAPVTANLVSGVATFTLTQSQVAELATAKNIDVNAATGANAAQIANQTPSASLALTTPAAALTSIGTATENTDRLLREGSNSTVFEWVGDANASTSNIFRLSGVPTTSVPAIRATLSGASAGSSFNGEYLLNPTNAVSAGGELILTNADIAAEAGSFGRANVSFSVEANGVSIRRFLLGTNGTLSTFDGDFDQTCSGSLTDNGTAGDADDATANAYATASFTCTQ